MEKISVAVRMRPHVDVSSSENSNGTFWKVEEDNHRISLHKSLSTPISSVSYAFDHVFDQDCSNQRVYQLLTKDIIQAAVQGFNGTAFAYGQTSSGKTFTMNGSESDPGIIHRGVNDIFANIQMRSDREFLIRVSYMEIYNEEINDLLAVENQKLQIHESLEHGIFVAGLREEIVNSAEQVLKLIQAGEVNRHFGETNMNLRSSRSHTIFRMVIESKGKDTGSSDNLGPDDAIRVSVLNLVDLAGSERIAKTGADGVRLKEGKHINKSLMILGNVINKLSDGSKQRGHIPYRDSKLTRILQPALGGNAKTSIICTLAPEEVHIEETKGTLQFASRAKRITNCVQLNEILTDAALLKRQKLEIEELRDKLQGSRAEVLEQEILKLRNDMLKYELEREKLAMELEEERRLQKERDQCIKDQQMKIDNLNSLVTSSDLDRISNQNIQEEGSNSHSVHQENAFKTPAAPSAFVVKRSNYSMQPDFSPFPIALNDVADEDTWLKMNKGYIADLESLHMTPARKVQSFPSDDISVCTNDKYNQEVEDLRRQLERSVAEKDELERSYAEQELLNQRLMTDISELQQEARLMQEVPQQLLHSIENCKYMYKDVFSNLQSCITGEESPASKLISSANEFGTSLFETLETHLSTLINRNGTNNGDIASTQQHCNMLGEKFKGTITSFVLPKSPSEGDNLSNDLSSSRNKDYISGKKITLLKEKLGNDLTAIIERYQSLEKSLSNSNSLLEVSKEKYQSLESEFNILKEDRYSLLQTVSNSSQRLEQVTGQKENVLRDLKSEVQRRRYLEDEIKQFGVAFASRQKSLMSFQNEFKSKIENLKAQNPIEMPKSLGY